MTILTTNIHKFPAENTRHTHPFDTLEKGGSSMDRPIVRNQYLEYNNGEKGSTEIVYLVVDII